MNQDFLIVMANNREKEGGRDSAIELRDMYQALIDTNSLDLFPRFEGVVRRAKAWCVNNNVVDYKIKATNEELLVIATDCGVHIVHREKI